MTLKDYLDSVIALGLLYLAWDTTRISRMLKSEAICRELNRTKAQEVDMSNGGTIRSDGGLSTRVEEGKSSDTSDPPLS